jgi:hypothetical protein
MDLDTVALFAPNRVDESLLVGGSFAAAFPLSNAATREFSDTARSTDLLLASCTFDVTPPRPRKIACVAIAAHNFTAGAKWRVQAYYDAAKTTLEYDSGLVDVWAAVYDSLDLEWEDDNFWTGQVSEEERASYQKLAIIIFPAMHLCSVVTISISDSQNAAGYVEFGRVFLADVWQPEINMSYDAGEGFVDDSTSEKTRSGTQYFDKLIPRRTCRFSLDYLTEAEAITDLRTLQRMLGITGEVLVCRTPDPSSPYFLSRTFIGRFSSLNDISSARFNGFAAPITIEEIT